ncbi:MAG TPA: hypothetical protein VHC44_00905 [Verrucomicrobiae bacterium]|nr:hypothetical protein [Verrucomicrobiae bacterium]
MSRHLIFEFHAPLATAAAMLASLTSHRLCSKDAASAKPRTAAPAIATGNAAHKYRKESFFGHVTKVVPKQAGLFAASSENFVSHKITH